MGTTTGGKKASADQRVEIDGRRLSVSNLDKVLWPETGFTKGEMIDYYVRVAPVLLPHLAGRPLSFKRFPDGVETSGFFAKNAPQGTPDWVRRVRLPTPGSSRDRETLDFVLVQDLPTLVWAANLAAIELHVPQWTVGPRGGVRGADLVVFDLDPGAPATVVECAQVALLLRDAFAEEGLDAWPKTSGSKGLQVYVPIAPIEPQRASDYAKALAQRLEKEHPALVTSKMAKAARPKKVFVDWSQNNGAKTTVAPYSLRARPRQWVSTPVTWDEVEACRKVADLQFEARDVLDRVARDGDLMAPLLSQRQKLP